MNFIISPDVHKLLTPNDLGCAAWYDHSSITGSGAKSQWDDESSAALHLTQATGGYQPIVTTIGSVNALLFDGTDDYMRTSSNPIGATISNAYVLLVVDIKTITASVMFNLSGDSYVDNVWKTHCPYTDYGGEISPVFFDVGGISGANRISYESSWGANTVVIMGFYCSTTDSVQAIWEDGVEKASDASGHSVSTNAYWNLGSVSATSVCDNFAIALAIIHNGTVDEYTRQKYEGIAAHRCGLESNLETTHPFRYNPPTVFS